MTASRPKLSLPKYRAVEETHDGLFDVAVYDVLLPCRQFVVRHKVTEAGRVSMTAEFLLRLLHSADGIDERDFGTFFGFDLTERSYVIREAEEAGYIARRNGRLWLTTIGRGLFRIGTDEPQIYEVEQKTITAGFDLLALAPATWDSLGRFELNLPELKIADTDKVAGARKLVPEAFRKFYLEFAPKFRSVSSKPRFLYSVDHVDPGNRFSSVVRVVAKSRIRQPGFPEPDLSEWRTGYDLDDRNEVVERCAAFLSALNAPRRPTDNDGYRLLREIAPAFTTDYMRGVEIDPVMLLKNAVKATEDMHADVPPSPAYTAAMAGSLFTHANARKLFETLRHSIERRKERPPASIWVVPQITAWGATRILPMMLEQLEESLGPTNDEGTLNPSPRSIALVAGDPQRHLREAFDLVASGPATGVVPPTVEIFVVPGHVVAIMVHAPLGTTQSFPVPVGLLSFDAPVVQRAQEILSDYIKFFSLAAGKSVPHNHRAFIEHALK